MPEAGRRLLGGLGQLPDAHVGEVPRLVQPPRVLQDGCQVVEERVVDGQRAPQLVARAPPEHQQALGEQLDHPLEKDDKETERVAGVSEKIERLPRLVTKAAVECRPLP